MESDSRLPRVEIARVEMQQHADQHAANAAPATNNEHEMRSGPRPLDRRGTSQVSRGAFAGAGLSWAVRISSATRVAWSSRSRSTASAANSEAAWAWCYTWKYGSSSGSVATSAR